MPTASLHVCTSDSWGGLELYACTLIVELQRAGNKVLAICKSGSKVESFLRDNHIQFHHLPSYRTISFKAVRFIRELIQQQDIEAVHVHFHKDIWPASLALCSDRNRRLILSIYMGVPAKNDIFHRFIFRRVDTLLTSSPALNKKLPSLYPIPQEKIHLLRYGRILDQYVRNEAKRASIRSKHGIQESGIVVGTMVRIDPGKGVMDFAQSFLYIDEVLQKNVTYLIVGEPTRKGRVRTGESPYEPNCKAYLQQLEGFIVQNKLERRVILAGFQKDLVSYLSAMDIFAFPSRDELYSLVVLDAMAIGLPVVAANTGGNIDQIDDGVNGLLYPATNSRELARRIEAYLSQPQLRKEHGERARKFVREHHDMVSAIQRLLQFYQNQS